jgi:hypothetical protein
MRDTVFFFFQIKINLPGFLSYSFGSQTTKQTTIAFFFPGFFFYLYQTPCRLG